MPKFDIEDIDESVFNQLPNDSVNGVRSRLKRNGIKSRDEPVVVESYVPGLQKIYIQTWGCSHNSSDSEYMAGLLKKYGYNVTLHGCENENQGVILNGKTNNGKTSPKLEADLWILNSCTVKNPAEDHFRNLVIESQKLNKKLVVAGCVPQGQPSASYLKGVSIVGVQQIDRVVEVVEETLKGGAVRLLAKKRQQGKKLGGADLDLPKIRKNPRIEILPVNTGCLNACTYCKTKHARGDLGSYTPEEIINRVDQAYQEGCVEIWLTSEDLGAYGIDLGTNIADLLEEMVHHIPEGCMLRLGMTNPPYILQHLDRIAKVLAHPRVYSFLHVPIQTGSNNVLGEMRREYTREEFCLVVDTLHNALGGHENVTIATDIICGFPTETDEDFLDTLEIVKKYKFKVLFTNQFFARPGTPAAKMERVASTAEVKQRTKQMHELFHSYEWYSSRIGKEVNVLVTEHSTDGRYLVGHTKAYEQVLVPLRRELLGRVIRVRIISSSKHSMLSELVDNKLDNQPSDVVYQLSTKNKSVNKFHVKSLSNRQISFIFLTICIVSIVIKVIQMTMF